MSQSIPGDMHRETTAESHVYDPDVDGPADAAGNAPGQPGYGKDDANTSPDPAPGA
jgi:hypothetical protein